jgi:hypothetical protein
MSSPLKKQVDVSHRETKRVTREIKTAAELVREIINPIIDADFEQIRTKSSNTMNESELLLCQSKLREELRRANNYLSRLIEKQLVQKAVAEKSQVQNTNLSKEKAIALL